MNYITLYNAFITYFKTTTPLVRLKQRNDDDYRLNCNDLYVENHHICPKFLNGVDTDDNMVLLLPEEHIFIHQLRYKAFDYREDMLAVRFCLNGISGGKKPIITEMLTNSKCILNKKVLQGYAWIRQSSSDFRKRHGWHTDDGIKRISNARKNKMPVKNSQTGEIIGSVDINHDNVLSGKWVHCTKGRIVPLAEKRMKVIQSTGINNPRYSGITDDEIINWGIELTHMQARIPSLPELRKYVSSKYNKNIPKSFSKWRFSDYSRYYGHGRTAFYKILEEKTGYKYNRYYKSESHRHKLSASTKNYYEKRKK